MYNTGAQNYQRDIVAGCRVSELSYLNIIDVICLVNQFRRELQSYLCT